jgi:hypothetical protein
MSDNNAPPVGKPPATAILDAASAARIELTGEQLEQLLQGESVCVFHPDLSQVEISGKSAQDRPLLSHIDALGSLVKDGLPIGKGWALGGSIEPGGLTLSLLKRF